MMARRRLPNALTRTTASATSSFRDSKICPESHRATTLSVMLMEKATQCWLSMLHTPASKLTAPASWKALAAAAATAACTSAAYAGPRLGASKGTKKETGSAYDWGLFCRTQRRRMVWFAPRN
ncbi:hypothetical protein BU14_0204s0026 [Porphyra umbilicalis]|uniref:Uncharacterized protein n=1 Tax=Porphyra umbilicalis TaxID=2786 RepID=A0A1X6P613_PORUM|nr:hypothetical protein BU14_0204s0026 [Porphyra umbilicalis]|eukprot:OSX76180.1 hypothetical protein BU14_0204s0026 [Porphyra umbilicalis]